MTSFSDFAQPVSLAPSPQANQALAVLRDAFMPTSGPSNALAVEQHMRNGADVVNGLMLDRSSGQLVAQSIDAWLATGGLQPYQPPFALPPRQEAQLNRRMSALIAQQKAKLPFTNAPINAQDPTMPLAAVTREPSRDRLHQTARTDLAEWLRGMGDRAIIKSDGDNTPPKAVQTACKRGLDLAPEFGGPGLTDGAKARARSMAAGNAVSDENVGRMANFFSRHQQNRADPSASEPTPGAVAWLLWGGDAGKKWAESKAGGTKKAGESWKKKGYVGPGGAWATAKRKAKGKGEAYARKIYSSMVGKSGGAGSRGGHVIGHTRSGKPVYERHNSSHADYKGFSVDDHQDAQAIHEGAAKRHHMESRSKRGQGLPDEVATHAYMSGHQELKAQEHNMAAGHMKSGVFSRMRDSHGILKAYLNKRRD